MYIFGTQKFKYVRFNYGFIFLIKNVNLYYRMFLQFNLILPNVKVMTLEEISTFVLFVFAKCIFVHSLSPFLNHFVSRDSLLSFTL